MKLVIEVSVKEVAELLVKIGPMGIVGGSDLSKVMAMMQQNQNAESRNDHLNEEECEESY